MRCYRTLVRTGLLVMSLSAFAAVRNETIQINVLDSETSSVVLDNSGVPKNCDMANYDAYCHNSIATLVTHALLVQVGNHAPFRVSCRLDTVWSRCRALTKGRTFHAKREKRGIDVYFVDETGKVRKQLYNYAEDKPKENAGVNTPLTLASSNAREGSRPEPGTNSMPEQRVQCDFTSSPLGAEISVDGRYVGSTPSQLNLSVGDHAVEVSLPGFLLWKRDLTVLSRSDVRVNAVLQKSQ